MEIIFVSNVNIEISMIKQESSWQRVRYTVTCSATRDLLSDRIRVMMIAPNSIVRQKGGAQGEEQKEVRGQNKGAPIAPTRSGVSDASNRKKHEQKCGILIHRRGRQGMGR